MLNSQFLHGAGELGGTRWVLAEIAGELEDRVAVAVEGQGYSIFSDQAAHEQEVAPGILLLGEQGAGHGTGGIVHCQQQRKPGTFLTQPLVVAAVDLQEHPLLGHTPAAYPVLLRPTAARAADASPD